MKILAFNMGHLACKMSKLKDFINQEEPDICLLQEGAGILWFDAIRWISLGWEVETCRMNGGFWCSWKLGILSKPNILNHKDVYLGHYDQDNWRRSVLVCKLQNNIRVVTLHLGFEKRVDQLNKVIKSLNNFSGKIDIIGGDFNMRSNNPDLEILTNKGFVLAGSDNVDHIFVRGCKPVNSKIVLDGVSDVHRGVLIEVEV